MRSTGWHIVAALLFILLGVYAIVEPTIAAVGIARLAGWLLIAGAAAHLIATFRGGGSKRVLLQILSAVVFALAGLYLLMHPLIAISTLTAVLALAIAAAGVFDIVTYFRLHGRQASGWLLLNGIVALLLGGMIWVEWPSSSVWAIGTLVGVNLLVTGVTRLLFGLAGRRVLRQATV
jgi:uncharacterized membrane protein HdeD (DUF308 family)